MMKITTVGIDLAKNVFSVHGIDEHGKAVLKRTVSRGKVMEVMANIGRCLVGVEACSGAHHWARELGRLGHNVKIMTPRFVAPYRKSGKNDGNDAEAICEAVGRPSMRFVAVKSAEQQALLVVHRVRKGLTDERTALINQLRGLLCEFGIVIPKGRYQARRLMAIPGVGPVTATAVVSTVGRATEFKNGRTIWAMLAKAQTYSPVPAA